MPPTARTGAVLGAIALGAGLVHAAPSVSVLPAVLPSGRGWLRATRLPGGWCHWSGPRDCDRIALTFDDGPSPATPRTLDLLDELGLRASFFLTGTAAAAQPGLVAEIHRRGHEIGSHGLSHRHHLLMPPAAVLADVAAGRRILEQAGAPAPRWFRPPYGQLAAASVVAARRAGMAVALWSCWGREFAADDTAEVLARLGPGLRGGAMVLLHDSDRYARPGTAARTHAVLAPLAAMVRRRGLRAVTISELLGPPAPAAAAARR